VHKEEMKKVTGGESLILSGWVFHGFEG
jgi:hypothetical protein